MTLVTTIPTRKYKFFLRIKRFLTRLADTAVVILLAMGYAEDSWLMLVSRVGVSGSLEAIEYLVKPEDEVPTNS